MKDGENVGGFQSAYEDDPRIAPLLHLFLDDLPQRMLAIREAIHSGDVGRLQRLTHQMKGTAYAYGYPEIANLARDIQEELTRSSGTSELLLERICTLESLCERAIGWQRGQRVAKRVTAVGLNS